MHREMAAAGELNEDEWWLKQMMAADIRIVLPAYRAALRDLGLPVNPKGHRASTAGVVVVIVIALLATLVVIVMFIKVRGMRKP